MAEFNAAHWAAPARKSMQARQGFNELADETRGDPLGERAYLDRAGATHPHHQRLFVDKALHCYGLHVQ